MVHVRGKYAMSETRNFETDAIHITTVSQFRALSTEVKCGERVACVLQYKLQDFN